MKVLIKIVVSVCSLVAAVGCSDQHNEKFRKIPSTESGITFQNDLKETVDFNIFNYMYFYNGAGVAVGDLNGDELPDIYFTANQGSNKLYINKGNLKFQDVTENSGVGGSGGWATGVTMADVNSDGKLDIYVSYVGAYLNFKGKNQLFINDGMNDQGIPTFTDRAAEFGLDLAGFSTQASFFDYDRDGDLDMFMLNHSLHQNGTFGKPGTLRYQVHPTAGDKLLRNDNGKFVEVTQQAGIYSSVLGYGLGVVVSDVNLDGWPDIFVGNDFHENDYLYINKGDGTFEEKLEQSMNHTSRYTMGVDFADFNNDAFPDLIAMDMLPGDYQRLKASAAEDPYDVYAFKASMGYNEQYTRNVLQLNNHDGTFSEIGLFAGVSATDWSWASLFADFDLDGDKDIFISNGILRRSNDLDYINFIVVDSIQLKMKGQLSENELRFIQKMPQVKVRNYLFTNNNDSTFTDKAAEWGMGEPSYSNGAAYADLDNDGDLDLITNNIDEAAFLYENKTINKNAGEKVIQPNYLQVKLEGSGLNANGIGAKVFLYNGTNLQMQECMPTRGFQSSVDYKLTFGLGRLTSVDSLIVVWNDGRFQKLSDVKSNQKIVLKQTVAAGTFNYGRFSTKSKMFQEVEDSFGVTYRHKENDYIEFTRDGLIPFMLSAEGPASAVGDINQDGLDDVYLGGAKWQPGQIFIQTKEKKFIKLKQPFLEADSLYEDVSAVLFDADNDKDLDLLVVSGGNEFYGKSKYMRPRLYLNEGKGEFAQSNNLPDIYLTGSCVRVNDFDKDGDLDVFIGARAIPLKYGIPPDSYILLNDGAGKFADATKQVAPELSDFGFVKDAIWADMDRDGDDDLIIAAEWRPISIFYNNGGKLQYQSNKGMESSGWWNALATADFDNDGDLDIIAGNLGLNSKLKAHLGSPVRMYVNDFDKNDSIEQILTHIVDGIEYPVNTRDEMAKQIPSLKKKYLSYKKFSEAPFGEFFSKDIIQESKVYEANVFESVYIENKGNGNFETKILPKASQLSSVNALLVDDFNRDGNLDVLAGGNFYRSNIQMGRYDASFGVVLLGDGKGNFKSLSSVESGLSVQGEIRRILPMKVGNQVTYIVVRNNETVKFLTLNE